MPNMTRRLTTKARIPNRQIMGNDKVFPLQRPVVNIILNKISFVRIKAMNNRGMYLKQISERKAVTIADRTVIMIIRVATVAQSSTNVKKLISSVICMSNKKVEINRTDPKIKYIHKHPLSQSMYSALLRYSSV
jgi:hypothetical protein